MGLLYLYSCIRYFIFYYFVVYIYFLIVGFMYNTAGIINGASSILFAGDKIEKNEMGWACGAYG